MAKKIVVYTTPWCGDCKAAKRFLGERGIAYEEVDIEGTIVSGNAFNAARFEKDLRAAGAL